MSDIERDSRRSSRDLDISRSRRQRVTRPKLNWIWLLLFCFFLFILFVWGNTWHPEIPLAIGLGAGVIILAHYIAWDLLVRRGVLSWMRMARAPARAMARGDADGAERLLERALARARRFAPDDRRRGMMLVELAGFVKDQARYAQTQALFDEAVEILAWHQRSKPLDYFIALNNYAIFFIHRRDHAAAQRLLERALDLTLVRKRDHGDKVVVVQTSIEFILQLNLTFLFYEMGELDEARYSLAEADELFAHLPTRKAHYTNHYRAIRALVMFALGRYGDAEEELARATDPSYPACQRVRTKLLLVRQEYADAERLLRVHLEREGAKGTPHRAELRGTVLDLAESLFRQGKHDEALAALAEARAIVADFALPPDTLWRRTIEEWLGRARALGRSDVAAALQTEAQQLATVPEHGIMVSARLRVRPAVS